MTAIELNDVSKTFGFGKDTTLAVDRLSFSVPQGSVYGLLGANGAGKTTSIRMMVSHLRPDSGTVRVLGHNPADHDESIRQRVAYISENMQLPLWMTIPEASKMMARLYPKWNPKTLEELTKRFRLDPKKQYREFSKGQRRAMCILLGLAQNADVLILDEPASGLDTLARRDFLTEMLDLACEENRTILFSSHILGDIERVVDRVAILNRGRKIVEGDLDSLKASVRKITLQGNVEQTVFEPLRIERDEHQTRLVVLDYSEEKLKRLCTETGITDTNAVEVQGLNLEDLFVEAVS
ncbi:MAG: ABC transporter ATP-binding protein [Planctomycetaceae bacterium]|nr:ABC transporter ATP-binding protein [Planctomycetaceae bacterium]